MKSARTRKSREDRIAEILAVAEEVFNERGFERATVAEIANRAGVVEGTVFRYFTSKHELVLHIISRWYEVHFNGLITGLRGITGTRNRLRYIIWSQLQAMTERAELTGAIILAARGLDESFTRQVNAQYERATRPLFETLAEGRRSGDIRSDIPDQLVSNMIYGAIEHSLWQMLQQNISLDIDQVADELVELIYGGIASPPEPDLTAGESRLLDRLESILERHEQS